MYSSKCSVLLSLANVFGRDAGNTWEIDPACGLLTNTYTPECKRENSNLEKLAGRFDQA